MQYRGSARQRLVNRLWIGFSWFLNTAVNKKKGLFLKTPLNRYIAYYFLACLISTLIGYGETGEPNTLGGYLVLILSLVLGLLFNNYGTKKQKFFFGGLVFFILIALAATLSRSSWLALGPMILALIWFSKRKSAIIITLIFVVIFSAILMPPGVKQRALFTFSQPMEQGQLKVGGVRIDTSTSARLASWKKVLTNDFYQKPLFGYGVTGYAFLDAQYPRVLAETGLIGFFTFVALLVAIFRNALQTRRRYADDPFYLSVSTGFLAGFFAMLAHAIGSNTFIIVRIMEPFWFLTAIVIMIPQIESSPRPDVSETDQRLLRPI